MATGRQVGCPGGLPRRSWITTSLTRYTASSFWPSLQFALVHSLSFSFFFSGVFDSFSHFFNKIVKLVGSDKNSIPTALFYHEKSLLDRGRWPVPVPAVD